MSYMVENTFPEKRFKDLLNDQKLKYTFERKTIFNEVAKINSHFDADSLYERFKKKGLRISRDTVYRTIPLLLESGVIQKSVGEGKRDFYERTNARGHHDHLVCIRCHSYIEFHSDEIELLQEKICETHGFKPVFHDHRLYGICKNCSKSA